MTGPSDFGRTGFGHESSADPELVVFIRSFTFSSSEPARCSAFSEGLILLRRGESCYTASMGDVRRAANC